MRSTPETASTCSAPIPSAGTTESLATGALVQSATSLRRRRSVRSDSIRVTLVVPDAATARSIIDASLRGDVTLIAGADLPDAGAERSLGANRGD